MQRAALQSLIPSGSIHSTRNQRVKTPSCRPPHRSPHSRAGTAVEGCSHSGDRPRRSQKSVETAQLRPIAAVWCFVGTESMPLRRGTFLRFTRGLDAPFGKRCAACHSALIALSAPIARPAITPHKPPSAIAAMIPTTTPTPAPTPHPTYPTPLRNPTKDHAAAPAVQPTAPLSNVEGMSSARAPSANPAIPYLGCCTVSVPGGAGALDPAFRVVVTPKSRACTQRHTIAQLDASWDG